MLEAFAGEGDRVAGSFFPGDSTIAVLSSTVALWGFPSQTMACTSVKEELSCFRAFWTVAMFLVDDPVDSALFRFFNCLFSRRSRNNASIWNFSLGSRAVLCCGSVLCCLAASCCRSALSVGSDEDFPAASSITGRKGATLPAQEAARRQGAPRTSSTWRALRMRYPRPAPSREELDPKLHLAYDDKF
jgi:hypothetical protein